MKRLLGLMLLMVTLVGFGDLGVSPPSVHQMIVKLQEVELITRESGVPRSVRVALAVGEISDLEDIED